MRFLILLITGLLLCNQQGYAANAIEMGNDFYKQCQNFREKSDNLFYGYCVGYIRGFLERTNLDSLIIATLYRKEDPNFCLQPKIPSSVTDDQAVDIVIDYLKAHAKERHIAVPIIVNVALSEAFPCPK